MNEQHPEQPCPAHPTITDRRALLAGIGGLAAGAVLAGRVQGGPLDPPPGPIAPTGKPLNELEPRIAINSTNTPGDADSMFKIIAPGSYYLTGNITGLVNRHGIEVAASGVTIDLNGFILRGLGTIQGDLDGVNAAAGTERITVRNGHIEVMGRDGINLSGSTRCVVEDVNVSLCLGRGIRSGTDSRVSRCTMTENTITGLSVGDASTIQDCKASENGGPGITTSTSSIIETCTAFGNAGTGISTNTGSRIHNCVANGNNQDGIDIASGGIVTYCVANSNSGNGIRVSSETRIVGNACEYNGVFGNGAGIWITGSDNRIESNHCAHNFRGIDVDSSGNIIIRNTCAGNTTNWTVVSGNNILVVNAVDAGSINGDAGGTSLGSTDPNANYTY